MSPTFKNLRSDYMKNLVWNLRKLSKIDPVMDLRFWKLKKNNNNTMPYNVQETI